MKTAKTEHSVLTLGVLCLSCTGDSGKSNKNVSGSWPLRPLRLVVWRSHKTEKDSKSTLISDHSHSKIPIVFMIITFIYLFRVT